MNSRNKVTDKQIELYLESKQLAWALTTRRSERYRLAAIAAVLDGNPTTLWAYLESKGVRPYSRCTTWVRVVSLVDFLIAGNQWKGGKQRNEYREWRDKNSRLFKNAYVAKIPTVGFAEANARVVGNQTAITALHGALRACEVNCITTDGKVAGKGGKVRAVFVKALQPDQKISYQRFYRALKKLDLTPHDLRKIGLNRLVELGATPFELQAAAGWKSVATAESYIKVQTATLQTLFNKMIGGEGHSK